MTIDLPAGSYIVAVSGGVDSVALLSLLIEMPNMRLTVAHYDHGIRKDSHEDRKLVASLAQQYGLPFVSARGELGSEASEAKARKARYTFLHTVRKTAQAQAIITAHHQDDVLETIILNLLRGTGRRGLSSLKSTDIVKRPLLDVPKQDLLKYAQDKSLQWREDSTNADDRYQRNYVRLHIMPRFSHADRQQLVALAKQAIQTNQLLDEQLVNYLHLQLKSATLDRQDFIMLPHVVAREVMAAWLQAQTSVELSRQLLERLVLFAKVATNGSKTDVSGDQWLLVTHDHLALIPHER